MRDSLLLKTQERVKQGRTQPDAVTGDGELADALRLKSEWLLRGQPSPTLDASVAETLIAFFWLRSRAGAEDENGVNWRLVEELAGLVQEYGRFDLGEDALQVAGAALYSANVIHDVQAGLTRAQEGDFSDLGRVCRLAEQLTQILPSCHHRYVEGFAFWGLALVLLPEPQRTDASAQQAIEHLRHAVRGAEEIGLPGLPLIRLNLVYALRTRYEHSANGPDLMELISTLQQVHGEFNARVPEAAEPIAQLTWAYTEKFVLLGDPADLDTAVRSARIAVQRAESDQREDALRDLAAVLERRYQASHQLSDLEESIWHQQAAIDAVGVDDSRHGIWLADLSGSLLHRFQHDDDDSALERAITVARAAIASGSQDPEKYGCAVALGNVLSARFERWGDRADGEESLQAHRDAVSLAATDPERSMALSNLGSELQTRYEREGNGADLDEALEAARASLRMCRPQEPVYAWRASNLAAALRLLSLRTGGRAELEEAIELGRQCLAVASQQRRLIIADRLGLALLLRFERFADHDDLDASIALHEQCAADGVPLTADHASFLLHLSHALADRYRHSGDVEDLNRALAASRQALAGLPREHAWGAGARNDVAAMLRARAAQLGREADLREAIEHLQQAASDSVSAPATLPLVVGNLGGAEVALYALTEEPAALTSGVGHLRRAIAELPTDAPERPVALGQLGLALRTQFEVDGGLHLLVEAIEVMRQALTHVAEGAEARPSQVQSLAEALSVRAERLGTRADIDEAVDLLRRAVAGTTVGPLSQQSSVSTLGLVLRRRFTFTNDVADLDASVDSLRQVLGSNQPDDVHLSVRYSSLCLSLRDRFGQLGDIADIHAAFEAGERSVAALGDRARIQDAGFHGNFALAAMDRFEAIGDITDLEVGIAAARKAIDLTPVGHPDRPMYMSNLTTGLLTRYHVHGQMGDLDEALDWAQAAVGPTPDDDAQRGARLSNLGAVLHRRYILTGERADLDRAVSVDRSALAATPEGHPSYVRYLSNQASVLIDLFRVTGERAYIDQAVDDLSRGVRNTAPGHRERGQYLNSLSGTLRARYDTFHASEDLAEAVAQLRVAVTSVPMASPERALYEMNLGLALLELSEQGVRTDDRVVREALEIFTTAAKSVTAPSPIRLRSAVHWGQGAASLEDWGIACDGFAYAVALLPQTAWHGLDRSTRESHLARHSGIATSAASCAIRAGRPEQAVELLDHGRTVLWQEQLNAATDLTRLAEDAPLLAGRLREIRRQLDSETDSFALLAAPTVYPEGPAASRPPAAVIADTRMKLAREWDEMLAEVRSLPAFADFLLQPSYAELVKAAVEGPAILLNASPYGCHGIVVRAGSPVLVVPLDLDVHRLVRQTEGLFNVVAQLSALSEEQLARESRALLDALEWLRRTVSGPVLDQLGIPDLSSAAPPRVWWCPTGVFTLLPIHASVLERVVSSYTSTLGALLRSRATQAEAISAGQGRRHLVVAVSDAPWQEPLPGVEPEVKSVRKVLSRHFEGQLLDGPRATHEAVTEQLRECTWLHLACHASQDILDPSDSAFALWDRELRVGDLISMSRAGRSSGELAYLSACQTSTGGVHLVDEAIHLAGALQAFGYCQVIGTLWSINDGISPDLAKRFYEGLSTPAGLDSGRAARSLNLATRVLRRQSPDEPFLWAAHVHSGP